MTDDLVEINNIIIKDGKFFIKVESKLKEQVDDTLPDDVKTLIDGYVQS